ncbi:MULTISPECIES: SHOCT domain-containing protein [unclassified Streptomyces]|uniref:SHOCT domain-containing protein n=1 Tax=unclassified Streptomyces TaxID=2593676 RepID=UPI001EF0016A|nr:MULTISPECIES: SHOCT domain-containing protein [unclassified Streptomyces]
MNGGAWLAMSLGMVVLWTLMIVLGVMALRLLMRAPGHLGTYSVPRPEQLLAERLARGEIDEDEYWRRLAVLRSADPLTKH